jgi:hypothetical protein
MFIEAAILISYFTFIFGLIYMANHMNQVANHPMTEQIVNKFRYNLRGVPRVDYKELSSDEDDQMSTSSSDTEQNEDSTLRQRRDPNPVGRIIEETLD